MVVVVGHWGQQLDSLENFGRCCFLLHLDLFLVRKKKRGAEKKNESESGVSSVACVFPAPLVNTRIHVLYGLQATPGHGVNVCYDRVWRDARDDCDDRYAGSTRAAKAAERRRPRGW